jgi:hypothetical protein
MNPPKNIMVGNTLNANWKPKPGQFPLFGKSSIQGPKKLLFAKFPNKNLAPQSDKAKKEVTFSLNSSIISFPYKLFMARSDIPLSKIKAERYF